MKCEGDIKEVAERLLATYIRTASGVAWPRIYHDCLLRLKLFLVFLARDTQDPIIYAYSNFTITQHGSYVFVNMGVLEAIKLVAATYQQT